MLHNIPLGQLAIHRMPYTPAFLLPLIQAAERGQPLEPPLNSLVEQFGFETFMFAMSANPRGHHESHSYVFTTLPAEWVSRYDQLAYVEIDPRILKTWSNALPLIWDYDSERGKDQQTDAFLDDAARHGVASGVAFGLHDSKYERVVVALNSSLPKIDAFRRAQIAADLGDILLLGTFFHEVFMQRVIEGGLAPISRGAPLSHRQRECLQLAAHGLSTEDIAYKLGITVRTAQFHFDAIRSKLAAANRQEAVAKGIVAGIISWR